MLFVFSTCTTPLKKWLMCACTISDKKNFLIIHDEYVFVEYIMQCIVKHVVKFRDGDSGM